jgi:hypothetical protein
MSLPVERIFDAAALPVWALMLAYFYSRSKEQVTWLFIAVLVGALAVDGYQTFCWSAPAAALAGAVGIGAVGLFLRSEAD